MPRQKKKEQEWWHGKFRGGGHRITLGREVILDILAKANNQHLSADDIYLRIYPKHLNIGLTTIYRTLELLSNMGLVFKHDFGDGRARYEIAEGSMNQHHHHLICLHCKRVLNYTDFIQDEIELLKKTEKGLSEKYNFRITNHLIQFYGMCKKCKNKK